MKRFALTTTSFAALALLAACAHAPSTPPPELVQAREAVRAAESDRQVLASAPLELKRATDSLNRANLLFTKRESPAEVASASYVAVRQAQAAQAIARAKDNEDAIRGAEADRERARADAKTAEAQRAQSQAAVAQARASVAAGRAADAELRASNAEQRASSAEVSAAVAQANAADSQQQAALLQQQLRELQAQPTDRGMLVTLGDVLFEFGRAEVKPSARGELAKVADFLRKHPTRRVLIEGFTDSVGSVDANLTLSRRRAESVAAALVSMGVPADRVSFAGYGKDYPVADNSSDTNRALNRRVEVYISNTDGPVQPRRG